MFIIRKLLLLSIMILSITLKSFADVYILNDKCIVDLFNMAKNDLSHEDIDIQKDSRGIILRYQLPMDISAEFEFTKEIYEKSLKIKYFLAKIENPAIIEVHTRNFADARQKEIRNWEISTLIANKLESIICDRELNVDNGRIKSVGYGEFLPIKNTPNNGGNYSNRVDIIILCNISGE